MLSLQYWIILTGFIYQAIAALLENRYSPPGQLIDLEGFKLHLYQQGQGDTTIVIDSSLGGLEGYLLIDELSKFAQVYLYDRAGYGWSDHSPHPRTSQHVVKELDTLLIKANVKPPYILIGDSFGSYNMRLYAHQHPEKVEGLVLTDGLHECGMLKMPMALQLLKWFFISGFWISVLGASFGMIRLLKTLGGFEVLKPGLKKFTPRSLDSVKRSFCRPKHWITMSREMINLEKSGRQLSTAAHLGTLPIVSIQSASFFTPSFLTLFVPLKMANRLRVQMHHALEQLSTNCQTVEARQSSHFVWIDEPEVMVEAVKRVITMAQSSR